jgi:hypothetical protein
MLYNLTAPQFAKTLQNLNKILEKSVEYATAKKFEVDVLLTSRLAPDQFNFIRQIQIACDTAKLGVSRLTGKEAPQHQDTEKTLAELQNRIHETITYLHSFSEADFKEASTRKVTHPRWDGKYLLGEDFCFQHLVPNFYFHVTTAYAILRHNGVDLGKKDYLGELPYKK